MNQILMIDNNKNKNKKEKKASGGPIEISSIARFFAIAILLFGLVLSGSGAYAMVTASQESANSVIPEVSMERSGNTVNVTISSFATSVLSAVKSAAFTDDTNIINNTVTIVTIPKIFVFIFYPPLFF